MEALEILKSQIPDAIISDIIMPDMDGYTLIKKIKSNPKMKNVPLIVSSCKSGMKEYFEYEDEIYKPDAYLEKPYQIKFYFMFFSHLLSL